MPCTLHRKTLCVPYQTNALLGSSSSTTARMVSPPTSPSGSTVSSPPRCKRFKACEAKRCKAMNTGSVYEAAPGSLLRAISQDEHEQYGRHEFGNTLRLCLSLFHQKLKSFCFYSMLNNDHYANLAQNVSIRSRYLQFLRSNCCISPQVMMFMLRLLPRTCF